MPPYSEPRSAQLTVPVLSEPLTQPGPSPLQHPPPRRGHWAHGHQNTIEKLFILATALFQLWRWNEWKEPAVFPATSAEWFHTVCNSRERERWSPARLSVAAHAAGRHLWASTATAPLGSPSTIHVPLRQKRGPAEAGDHSRSARLCTLSAMTHVRPGSTCPAHPMPAVTSPLSFWTRDRNHYPHPRPIPLIPSHFNCQTKGKHKLRKS